MYSASQPRGHHIYYRAGLTRRSYLTFNFQFVDFVQPRELDRMAELREDAMELQRLDGGLPEDIDYDLEYLVRNR